MRKLILFFILLLPIHLLCQQGCNDTFIKILGSVIENEKGYSLAVSLDQKTIFLGGIKNDSAIIIKLSQSGNIEWTRAFDVVKGKPDHIYRILVDSDNFIVVSGISGSQTAGGTVFAFKYDHEINKILWAKEFVQNSINFNLGLIEINQGGDYLMTNNVASPNDAELIRLDRNSGDIDPNFSKHYHLGSSESIYDLVTYNGMIYASGRFTDGGSTDEMRTVLLKIDPDDGSLIWNRLGIKPANSPERLYGLDLIIAQDKIFSVFLGDPSGSDIDHSKCFVLKSDLDGNLEWVKQYELPGPNDWVDEIINSNGGLVILGRNRVGPSDLILFKIDYEGHVLWAWRYDYAFNDNAVPQGSIQSQLIEANGYYYFIGFAEENGNSDMILVRTDLNGKVSDTCSYAESISLQAQNVTNPIFYQATPNVFHFVPDQNNLTVQPGQTTNLQHKTICNSSSVIEGYIEAVICQGDSFEFYKLEGQYVDHFTTSNGCDSLRMLNLYVRETYRTMIDQGICFGESFEGYIQAGTFIDTFSSAYGCDSIRTLKLSIDYHTQTLDKEICAGGHYEGYSMAGVYIDTIQGKLIPCDTIRTLYLSVLPPIRNKIYSTICDGDNYLGYASEGVYIDTFQTVVGCDSIRTVTIEKKHNLFVHITASICEDEHHGYQVPGLYVDSLRTIYGCDSIRELELKGVAKYTPNVFSPNNDGINDAFIIAQFPDNFLTLQYFAIFDRGGNLTYETNSLPIYWNGKDRNGIFYDPGVFTYLFIYTCGQKKITESGDITVIR